MPLPSSREIPAVEILRRSRYIGLAKTHLQHLGIAAAINLVRVVAWLDGDEPAPTRLSAFQRLYNAA